MVGSINSVVQKRIILCLFWARRCCLFICVLNVLNFTNVKLHLLHLICLCFIWLASSIQLPKNSDSMSTQGRTTFSFHVCNNCVLFYKYEIALIASKLSLFHVVDSNNTVAQKMVILCLPRARRYCLFMCVLDKFYKCKITFFPTYFLLFHVLCFKSPKT